MKRSNEVTSKRVARSAARALKDPKAGKREKSLAGSALTQRATKGKATVRAAAQQRLVRAVLAYSRAVNEYHSALDALTATAKRAIVLAKYGKAPKPKRAAARKPAYLKVKPKF